MKQLPINLPPGPGELPLDAAMDTVPPMTTCARCNRPLPQQSSIKAYGEHFCSELHAQEFAIDEGF